MLSSRLYLPVPWQIRQINGINVAEFKSNHTKVSLSVFPYSLYIFPLDYIVRHHGLEFHPRRRHPTLPALLCFKAHYSRATVIFSAYRSMCESCRFLIGPKQTEGKQGKNRASYSECQPSPTSAYWGYPSIQWTNNACEFRKEHRSRLRSRNDSRRARHYHNFYLKLFFVHHKNIARIRESLTKRHLYPSSCFYFRALN